MEFKNLQPIQMKEGYGEHYWFLQYGEKSCEWTEERKEADGSTTEIPHYDTKHLVLREGMPLLDARGQPFLDAEGNGIIDYTQGKVQAFISRDKAIEFAAEFMKERGQPVPEKLQPVKKETKAKARSGRL